MVLGKKKPNLLNFVEPIILCRTLTSGARRRGEPSIDFGVFCFIVNKGVAT
jgi:hypothetical protein